MFKILTSLAQLLFVLVATSMVPASAAQERTLLVYGDSLSAGYGIATRQAWPSLLSQRLKEQSKAFTVANASISGETTAGGRARFERAMEQFKPAIVIIALGANDGLRGLPVAAMKENLAAMVRSAKRHGAKVLLIGMRLPPNYGKAYTDAFAAAFRELAQREKTAFLPFLLEPIATEAAAFQPDGLHPVAAAQGKLLEPVWQALQPLIK